MSEIPNDIMETAREAYAASPVKVQGHREANVLIGVIARAVLAERERATAAERERCAAIAHRETVGPMYDGDQMWRGGYENCAEVIEQAILTGARS